MQQWPDAALIGFLAAVAGLPVLPSINDYAEADLHRVAGSIQE
jgi:hypothetical protein